MTLTTTHRMVSTTSTSSRSPFRTRGSTMGRRSQGLGSAGPLSITLRHRHFETPVSSFGRHRSLAHSNGLVALRALMLDTVLMRMASLPTPTGSSSRHTTLGSYRTVNTSRCCPMSSMQSAGMPASLRRPTKSLSADAWWWDTEPIGDTAVPRALPEASQGDHAIRYLFELARNKCHNYSVPCKTGPGNSLHRYQVHNRDGPANGRGVGTPDRHVKPDT